MSKAASLFNWPFVTRLLGLGRVSNASSACARRSSSRLARLSARRRQSALTGMKTLGLLEIVLSIVPFRSLRTALRSLAATLAPAAMAIVQCNIWR